MRPVQPVVGPRPTLVIVLLILSWISAAFGNSLQPISILALLHPLVLLITHEACLNSFRSPILAYTVFLLVQALGFEVGFAGALSFPYTTPASLVTTLILGSLFCSIRTFGVLLPARRLRHVAAQVLPTSVEDDRLITRPRTLNPLGTLLLILPLWSFPILSTAVNTLFGLGFGRFADPALPLLDWPPIAQLTSLFGIWGVGFLQDLFSSCAFIFLTYEPLPLERQRHPQPHQQQPSSFNDHRADSAAIRTDSYAAHYAPSSSRIYPRLRRHVVAAAAALCALVVLGGGLVYSGSFYQRSVEQALKGEERLPVSCLAAEAADVGTGDYLWIWQKTAERVAAGDRFVLWSEAAVSVTDDEEELGLLAAARDLLAAHGYPGGPAGPVGTYLGLCYQRMLGNGSTSANHFALMDPTGTLVWNYRKSHPVPGVEDQVVPGPPVLPTASSPYGTLGGAICLDMDWPAFIRQAGTAGVALMLQPSWTWGAVGPRHFGGNAARAIENGFTTFRCSSSGVSGAISPHGVVWHYLLTGARDVLTFTLPLHPRRATLYVHGGWLLEWINLAAAGALLTLLLVPRQRLVRRVEVSAIGGEGATGRGAGAGGDGREPLLPS